MCPDEGADILASPVGPSNYLSDDASLLNEVCLRKGFCAKRPADPAGRIAVGLKADVMVCQEFLVSFAICVGCDGNHDDAFGPKRTGKFSQRRQFFDAGRAGRFPEIYYEQFTSERSRTYPLPLLGDE
jgi:hypothetical protein